MLVSPSGTFMESACRPDHAPAMSSVCEEAAMNLRLMEEQAVGIASCSRMKDACHSNHAPAMRFVKKLA